MYISFCKSMDSTIVDWRLKTFTVRLTHITVRKDQRGIFKTDVLFVWSVESWTWHYYDPEIKKQSTTHLCYFHQLVYLSTSKEDRQPVFLNLMTNWCVIEKSQTRDDRNDVGSWSINVLHESRVQLLTRTPHSADLAPIDFLLHPRNSYVPFCSMCFLESTLKSSFYKKSW